MTFDQIPPSTHVFLDANTLVYHFGKHPKFGAACSKFVNRVEQRILVGFVSIHGAADVAHRLMTIEAMGLRGWPPAGIAARLRKNHHEIANLNLFEQAIQALPQLNIQMLPITQPLLEAAALLSKRYELLTGDALVVAVMQDHGLSNLASNDDDFDRVPGMTRYAPV